MIAGDSPRFFQHRIWSTHKQIQKQNKWNLWWLHFDLLLDKQTRNVCYCLFNQLICSIFTIALNDRYVGFPDEFNSASIRSTFQRANLQLGKFVLFLGQCGTKTHQNRKEICQSNAIKCKQSNNFDFNPVIKGLKRVL